MKKYEDLLKLARQTLEDYFNSQNSKISLSLKKKYSKRQACFVTLTLDGELRGCIGSIEAKKELWKDVIENSLHAAFDDTRFNPLEKSEINKIKIEVSVLSPMKKLIYLDNTNLLKKIKNKGVLIKSGFYSAVYLPQVWENLPQSEEFLSSLCEKAGLSRDYWKEHKLEVYIYTVDNLSE
jgi:AmmeMemoRadiSam system protein A